MKTSRHITIIYMISVATIIGAALSLSFHASASNITPPVSLEEAKEQAYSAQESHYVELANEAFQEEDYYTAYRYLALLRQDDTDVRGMLAVIHQQELVSQILSDDFDWNNRELVCSVLSRLSEIPDWLDPVDDEFYWNVTDEIREICNQELAYFIQPSENESVEETDTVPDTDTSASDVSSDSSMNISTSSKNEFVDEFDSWEYTDPEDFYYDYYDDFYDFEDAEDYWREYSGNW